MTSKNGDVVVALNGFQAIILNTNTVLTALDFEIDGQSNF